MIFPMLVPDLRGDAIKRSRYRRGRVPLGAAAPSNHNHNHSKINSNSNSSNKIYNNNNKILPKQRCRSRVPHGAAAARRCALQ